MTVISNHEEREVAILDITNVFIQTKNPKKVADQRDIVKTRVKLVQVLVEIDPEVDVPYIAY